MSENLEAITQGSDEWLRWREKGIGSSDVAAILGVSPYKTAHRLWSEKVGLVEAEDLSLNFIVARGTSLEPEARELVNKIIGKEFKPRLFMSSQYEWARYSSDGACDNEIIEIKCPMEKNHKAAVLGEIPDHYMMQMQYGLMVSGADKCFYVSYNPDHADKIAIIPVSPDVKLHAEMAEACDKFWQNVKSETPPPLTNKDKVECNDIRFQSLVHSYRNAKMKQIIADEAVEAIEKEMKDFADTMKYLNIHNDGVNMIKIKKKGTVDYSKIDALKGVDLEQYRRSSSTYWTIRMSKGEDSEA